MGYRIYIDPSVNKECVRVDWPLSWGRYKLQVAPWTSRGLGFRLTPLTGEGAGFRLTPDVRRGSGFSWIHDVGGMILLMFGSRYYILLQNRTRKCYYISWRIVLQNATRIFLQKLAIITKTGDSYISWRYYKTGCNRVHGTRAHEQGWYFCCFVSVITFYYKTRRGTV